MRIWGRELRESPPVDVLVQAYFEGHEWWTPPESDEDDDDGEPAEIEVWDSGLPDRTD